MRSLIIGGTRNLGPAIVQRLLQQGHHVTVLNRGQTRDDLPKEVERLKGDRTVPQQLKGAVAGREFDLVIDTTLYTGAEAKALVEVFGDRVGRYLFLSTGQVYLVRIGVERPFREEDYEGSVMDEPPQSDDYAHSNWLYGADKRAAEDVFVRARAETKFPFTSLRLPMVNSERDHYNRIYGYFLRLQDGGPILLPEGEGLPVRHVYGEDVVQAIMRLTDGELGKGRAYNIGQDETVTLAQFLEMLAELVHRPLRIASVPRSKLESHGLLPHCSPFSGKWMSSLDNTRSKTELGMVYTPMREYLRKLVDHYLAVRPPEGEGYTQRARELQLAELT